MAAKAEPHSWLLSFVQGLCQGKLARPKKVLDKK
jgi:hypothetical protein